MSIPTSFISEKNDVARTVTEFYTAIPGPILGPGQGTELVPFATDCRIIDANNAAVELMGFPSRDALNGVCLSMIRDKQQSENSRILLMAARTRKFKKCNDESMQCFYRPDGERVWCKKSVVTLNLPTGTVWVTELRVSSRVGEVPAYAPEDFGLTPGEIIRVCGTHTVSMVQDELRKASLTTSEAIHTMIPDNVQVHNLKNCKGLAIKRQGSEKVRYVYVCSKCNFVWTSNIENPKQCANRKSCASEQWRGSAVT